MCSKRSWCFSFLPPSLTSELEDFPSQGTCRFYYAIKELWIVSLSPLLASYD